LKNPDDTDQLSPVPASKNSITQIFRLSGSTKTIKSKESPKCNKKQDSLWYALYFPQLEELSESRQKKLLSELASAVRQVSSEISFHSHALICEIRSSLKYFGGMEQVHDKLAPVLNALLQQRGLPGYFLYAASPTVTGSLLLARSGHNVLVYQKNSLRSALGRLPTNVLRLSKEQNCRLYNMGVRYLRDIWRLPANGLHTRFGGDFVNLLNKALGKAPEPIHNYLPPPAFSTSYDLPVELENLDRLSPVVDEVVAQLCEFLRHRDLCISHLLFSLQHEKRDNTEVDLALRRPNRSQEHLIMLLETHFSNLIIPAPVTGVKLKAKKFNAFIGRSNSLLAEDRPTSTHGSESDLDQFVEQLHAKLADNYLKCIRSVSEHCPEYANQQTDYGEPIDESSNGDGHRKGKEQEAQFVALAPRPLWLLREPKQLVLRNSKLYHRKAVTLISGPERIETFWWSGTDVCRDYYVAREASGSRLWVYRERTSDKNWYLHGYFA